MIFPTTLIDYILQGIAGLVIAVITFLVTKKRMQDAQIKRTHTDTELVSSDIIIKNLDIYQKMLDDIEERYEEKLKKRDEEIRELEDSVELLKEKILLLEEECARNKNRLNNLK